MREYKPYNVTEKIDEINKSITKTIYQRGGKCTSFNKDGKLVYRKATIFGTNGELWYGYDSKGRLDYVVENTGHCYTEQYFIRNKFGKFSELVVRIDVGEDNTIIEHIITIKNGYEKVKNFENGKLLSEQVYRVSYNI